MKFDVAHVAELAKLQLTPEEFEKLDRDMNAIMERVSRLMEVDVEGVPPTFGTTDLQSVRLAPDVERVGLKRESVLKNAPSVQDVYIKVPREKASG